MNPARLAGYRMDLSNPFAHSFDKGVVRELLDYIGELQRGGAVVVPAEVYPGQREHVAFLGALKYDLENPAPSQAPTSFDINRDYFEHYATVFSKDNERMAHGVGFTNGASWHREHFGPASSQVLADGMVGVDREELDALRSFYEIIRCHMMAEGGIPMSDALGAAMDSLDAIRSAKGAK